MNRNEADTRAELIDPLIVSAGWGVVENSFIRREVSITQGRILGAGKRASSLSSDYVLEYKGRKLAAIEAKRENLSYTEGVRQAKDYAQRLQCRIAYATNGHELYQIDLVSGEEKLVDRFLSPDELWALTFDGESGKAEPEYTSIWRTRFAQIPFECKGDWQPRYYQENAINNALEAIAHGKQKILLTLATGTGKTCIAFQLAWKLFNSRWSLPAQKNPSIAKKRPRILFLADRNVLTKQAFNDFGAFGEDAVVRITPSEIKKAKGVPKNASIFMAIFQTLMTDSASNLSDKNNAEERDDQEDEDYTPTKITNTSNCNFRQYPADFFDFIIIDECHRGGANDESSWRDILDYFSPAVQLGLTATPKRTDNADSYKYFGEPVYSYTLKDGINDGFLTPFKVYPIVGTMDEYIYTAGDGVVVQGDPEEGKLYTEGDFNRTITIDKREEKRVHYWMDKIIPHDKTIVFCATQAHAGKVRDYINQYARQKNWTTNTHYSVRVTANDGIAGETFLKTFQDNEKTIPTILTTSRKLSTGVDARNVRNIVLMRPCNNMIEFKQIIGRGTRMYDGKDFFTVFDFVKAHHNFADPLWDGDPEPLPPCESCNKTPCICEALPCDECGFLPCCCPKEICADCGNDPCTCDQLPCGQCNKSPCECQPEPCQECDNLPCTCKKTEKIEIKLSDGKTRQIHHISSVMYWNADGKPITAKEFIERLFDDLPQFFENEDELREIWGDPVTREKLMSGLSEAGYDHEKLEEMKALIDAKQSDVYDVLKYVAFASKIRSREERVNLAKPVIGKLYDYKQQAFISFILNRYLEDGIDELAPQKMRSLIELKYNNINGAVEEFGSPVAIRETFVGFQKHLYAQASMQAH